MSTWTENEVALPPSVTADNADPTDGGVTEATKSQWDFSIGFWIIAENKLCGKHTFMILTRFVQQDNLHKWTPLLWFLKCKCNRQK